MKGKTKTKKQKKEEEEKKKKLEGKSHLTHLDCVGDKDE